MRRLVVLLMTNSTWSGSSCSGHKLPLHTGIPVFNREYATGMVVASSGRHWAMASISPVSATTVVMVFSWSSLFVIWCVVPVVRSCCGIQLPNAFLPTTITAVQGGNKTTKGREALNVQRCRPAHVLWPVPVRSRQCQRPVCWRFRSGADGIVARPACPETNP